jgi:uncharacterized membrane protein YphA (DoxX/SURF4 family)
MAQPIPNSAAAMDGTATGFAAEERPPMTERAQTPTVNGDREGARRGGSSRARMIAYWISTGYVALAMFYGGLAEVLDAAMGLELSSIGIATVVAVLGYPPYVVYITGIGKVLGAIAIVVPRFPRLKEWAYAGLVFNMAGALLSWLVVTVIDGVPVPEGYGSPVFHVVNALHLIVIIGVSWALRPESRVLGAILPEGRPRAVAT